MGKFDMMALMNAASQSEAAKPRYEMKTLPISTIIPNPANHYSMDGIDELADAILLAGRVLQNIVVKAADKDGVLADGQTAGEANNYVKAGDERVIAHTKLLNGGEQDSVTFDVSKLAKGEAYEYYCSFPGHYATMNGKLTLVD